MIIKILLANIEPIMSLDHLRKVQWIAKLCADSIDNDVRYQRENIKFWN